MLGDGRVARKRVIDKEKVALARRMMADRETSAVEVARVLGVSKPTLYRYLREAPASANGSGEPSSGDLGGSDRG